MTYISTTDTQSAERYEHGVIVGDHRNFTVINAQKSFDSMSSDNVLHVLNIHDANGQYINTVAVSDAHDDEHAKLVASKQFDSLIKDNGYAYSIITFNNNQFDSANNHPSNAWPIHALENLASNSSQYKSYKPAVTASELQVESCRTTFETPQWDGVNLISHSSNDALLYQDVVRLDKHHDLIGNFDLHTALRELGATVNSFDSLMDTANRLPLLKERLFKAMNGAKVDGLSVENVIQTKEFKRQGVKNVAFVFDMSDGQKISIWFHNPDSTPNKVLPSDIMISWKWLINKRDVTAVLSPKHGENVQLPTLAGRMMRLVAKNSKRFQRAQTRKAKVEKELLEAQKLVEDKEATIEKLDSDIDGLNKQIDEAVKAVNVKADTSVNEGDSLLLSEKESLKNYINIAPFQKLIKDLSLKAKHDKKDKNSHLFSFIKETDTSYFQVRLNGYHYIAYYYVTKNRIDGSVLPVSDSRTINAKDVEFEKVDNIIRELHEEYLSHAESQNERTIDLPNDTPIHLSAAVNTLNNEVLKGKSDSFMIATVKKDGSIVNRKIYKQKAKAAITRYENENLYDEDTEEVLRVYPVEEYDHKKAGEILERLGYSIDRTDPEGFIPSWYEKGQVYQVKRRHLFGKDTVNPEDDEFVSIELLETFLNSAASEARFNVTTLGGGYSVTLTTSEVEAMLEASKWTKPSDAEIKAKEGWLADKHIATYENSKGREIVTISYSKGLYQLSYPSGSNSSLLKMTDVVSQLQSTKADNPSMRLKSGTDLMESVEPSQPDDTTNTLKPEKVNNTPNIELSPPSQQNTFQGFAKEIEHAVTQSNYDDWDDDPIEDSDIICGDDKGKFGLMMAEDDNLSPIFNGKTYAYIKALKTLSDIATDKGYKLMFGDFNHTATASLFDSMGVVGTYGVTAQLEKDGRIVRAEIDEYGRIMILSGAGGTNSPHKKPLAYSSKKAISTNIEKAMADSEQSQEPEAIKPVVIGEVSKLEESTNNMPDIDTVTTPEHTKSNADDDTAINVVFDKIDDDNTLESTINILSDSKFQSLVDRYAQERNNKPRNKDKPKMIINYDMFVNALRQANEVIVSGYADEFINEIAVLKRDIEFTRAGRSLIGTTAKQSPSKLFSALNSLSNKLFKKRIWAITDEDKQKWANQSIEPKHPSYTQEDIDYLNSIIDRSINADDVDMDKVIEIGEKDEEDSLFITALDVIENAVDQASANL